MMEQIFNPFLPDDIYIPDGEPHVFGDRVYLFGSHDMEDGESYCMLDYEGWSAPIENLGKWESAGIIYSAKQDPLYSEKRPYMYAPDVVCGNDGKYYLYYCLAGWRGDGGYDGPISVAVSDKPNGKYEYLGFVKNPDGEPFQDVVLFDPAVINDDGVIRLYTGAGIPWGWQLKWWNTFLVADIASRMYHRPKSAFKRKNNPLGAFMLELAEDMCTVKSTAKRILPEPTKKNGFKGHAFYEGASIRKIRDTYYFVYSSQKNHELCYATSKYPDRDFVYGGTIVSNGDVGYDGRSEKERVNVTGTTHGGIECINDQCYVFYHRLSHGTDYSRQACAEPITISQDGSIRQVEVSSCGLNGGPLNMESTIPAVKACMISNGHMPHISNQRCKEAIPMVTNCGTEHFITNITDGVELGYKYVDYTSKSVEIKLVYRGMGNGICNVFQDLQDKSIGCLEFSESDEWREITGVISPESKVAPLFLRFEGNIEYDLLSLSFEKCK